jgi:hypothetical protein
MKPRTFQMLDCGGVRLRTVVEGTGPLCVLVHGWPESWYSWRHQIDPLVAAGYRVAVPDVRGYGGSDKPEAIEAYDMISLTDDVVGLIDALGEQQATATLAGTMAMPSSATGLAIGVIYSVWNFGSCVGMAVGGLIFEEADKRTLNAALLREDITLSAQDQELVRSVLSDPSQAQQILGKLTPGLEAKIQPIFKDAFMAGYSGAMWYLLITCAVGAVLVPLIARRGRREA